MRKPKKLILPVGIIISALFFIVLTFKQNYMLPILMYHSVTPQAHPEQRTAVNVKTFDKHMRFLKKHNYNVLTLETAADLIRNNRKIPPRSVVITFDDGYKDNYIYAFPILKKYNLPATIFIIINEVDRPENDRLSWEEIKIMHDSGIIDFGSHTLGAEPLIDIKSEEELKKQIFDSKKILEGKLGIKVNSFSYPGGMFDSKIRQLVINAGYKFAVSTNPGKKIANHDIFALKRLRISSNADNLFIFWVETGGYYNFMREHRRK